MLNKVKELNKTGLPGFNAEASLYRVSEQYKFEGFVAGQAVGDIVPAQITGPPFSLGSESPPVLEARNCTGCIPDDKSPTGCSETCCKLLPRIGRICETNYCTCIQPPPPCKLTLVCVQWTNSKCSKYHVYCV